MSVPSGGELDYICALLMHGTHTANQVLLSNDVSVRRKKPKRRVHTKVESNIEAKNDIQGLSRPGSKSTANALHCGACDVWVANKPGNWAVHTAGIRHRRQVLSIREHGVGGELVLSTFECVEQVSRSHLSLETPVEPSLTSPRLEQYKTSLLVEILNAHGPGTLYRKAATRLDDMLRRADDDLGTGNLLGEEEDEEAETSLRTLMDLCCLSDSSQSPLQTPTCLTLRMKGGAGTDPLHIAIWMASTRLLLCEIGKRLFPNSIFIRLPASMEGASVAVVASYHQALKHTLLALRHLCSRYAALSKLEISLRCHEGLEGEDEGQEGPSNTQFLITMVESEKHLMEEGLAGCVDRIRLTLAMSQHKIVGGESLLSLLPISVLHRIMELVAPLKPVIERNEVCRKVSVVYC